jgi:hypothetical protein
MIDVLAFAETITEGFGRELEREARPSVPHPYMYASAFRVCDRRAAYELTQPEKLPPFPPEVLARFRRGNDRERDLLTDLARVGRNTTPAFTVIGQQERFVLKDHKGRVAISGKVDARLDLGPTGRPPLEVKAWSPRIVDDIERFEDVLENTWTQSGAYQLLTYLFAAGEPYGFLLLDRSGLPKVIPVTLDNHLDLVEAFLAKAERVLDAVIAGTLPPFLPDDPSECRRCPWYGAVCNPPLEGGEAYRVLTDPTLEALLERREAVKAAGKEFLDLDKEAKQHLRGVTAGVIGPFAITGKWGKQSRLDLPADLETQLKKQYTRVDPKGRFTLDITRLG